MSVSNSFNLFILNVFLSSFNCKLNFFVDAFLIFLTVELFTFSVLKRKFEELEEKFLIELILVLFLTGKFPIFVLFLPLLFKFNNIFFPSIFLYNSFFSFILSILKSLLLFNTLFFSINIFCLFRFSFLAFVCDSLKFVLLVLFLNIFLFLSFLLSNELSLFLNNIVFSLFSIFNEILLIGCLTIFFFCSVFGSGLFIPLLTLVLFNTLLFLILIFFLTSVPNLGESFPVFLIFSIFCDWAKLFLLKRNF